MDDNKEKDDTQDGLSSDYNVDVDVHFPANVSNPNIDIDIPPLPSPNKKKTVRNELTLKIKEALLNDYEKTPKPTLTNLAQKYKIGRSTVSDIIQRKDEYRKLLQNGGEGKVKRLPMKTKYTELNSLIYEWYMQEKQKSDQPITGHVLKNRALKLAEEMQLHDFRASEGWLFHWRQRYLVNKLYVPDEGTDDSVDPEGNLKKDTNDIHEQCNSDDIVTEIPENMDDGKVNDDSEKGQVNHGSSTVTDEGKNSTRCSSRKRKKKTFRDYVSLTEDLEPTLPTPKKGRRELSLDEKRMLISDYEQFKPSQRELARRYNIGRSTVFDIIKRKELYKNLLNGDIGRLSYGGKYVHLNQALYEWFCQQEKCDYKQVRAKAKQLALEMNLTEFKVSNGWFESWKQRYIVKRFNLSFETISALCTTKFKKEAEVNETEETSDQPYVDECSSSHLEEMESFEPIVQIETVDSVLPLPVRTSSQSEAPYVKKSSAHIMTMKMECEEFQANGADEPKQANQENTDQSGLLQYMKFCDKKTTQKLESSIQSDLTTAEIQLENILVKINESDANVEQLKEERNEKSKIIQEKLQEVYEHQSQLYELDNKQEQASTENKRLKQQLLEVREKVQSCNQALVELKNI